jgi:hypothetical protein
MEIIKEILNLSFGLFTLFAAILFPSLLLADFLFRKYSSSFRKNYFESFKAGDNYTFAPRKWILYSNIFILTVGIVGANIYYFMNVDNFGWDYLYILIATLVMALLFFQSYSLLPVSLSLSKSNIKCSKPSLEINDPEEVFIELRYGRKNRGYGYLPFLKIKNREGEYFELNLELLGIGKFQREIQAVISTLKGHEVPVVKVDINQSTQHVAENQSIFDDSELNRRRTRFIIIPAVFGMVAFIFAYIIAPFYPILIGLGAMMMAIGLYTFAIGEVLMNGGIYTGRKAKKIAFLLIVIGFYFWGIIYLLMD